MYRRHSVAGGRRRNLDHFREFDLGSHFGLVSARRDIGNNQRNRPVKSLNRQDFT